MLTRQNLFTTFFTQMGICSDMDDFLWHWLFIHIIYTHITSRSNTHESLIVTRGIWQIWYRKLRKRLRAVQGLDEEHTWPCCSGPVLCPGKYLSWGCWGGIDWSFWEWDCIWEAKKVSKRNQTRTASQRQARGMWWKNDCWQVLNLIHIHKGKRLF
jgi:hypothetical protein